MQRHYKAEADGHGPDQVGAGNAMPLHGIVGIKSDA